MCLVTQSHLTLCDLSFCRRSSPPRDQICITCIVTCQAPLSMGILQAKILEWVAMPSFKGCSQPRDWTQVSCIVGRFFNVWATRVFNILAVFLVSHFSLLVYRNTVECCVFIVCLTSLLNSHKSIKSFFLYSIVVCCSCLVAKLYTTRLQPHGL